MCNPAKAVAILNGTATAAHLKRPTVTVTSAPVTYLTNYLNFYAGRNYDVMFAASNAVSPNAFTADDLLAIRSLSVTTTARFREWLLSPVGHAATSPLLARIPRSVDLSTVTPARFPSLLGSSGASPVSELWNLLVEQQKALGHGRGIQVVASKLIAGKRPRLVPITDSFVRQELGISGWGSVWTCSHTIATDPAVGTLVASLRSAVSAAMGAPKGPLPSGVNPSALSDLRILDLAVWCFHERRLKK